MSLHEKGLNEPLTAGERQQRRRDKKKATRRVDYRRTNVSLATAAKLDALADKLEGGR